MILKENEIYKPIQVNIFGSCVTRDAFAFDEKKQFKVGEYIARQSVISFLSKPLAFDDSCIHLSSSFQRNQLFGDLSKNAFTKLKDNPGDCLVIDMIEERFKIGKISGTYFTDSNELDNSGFLEKYNARFYENRELHGKVFFRSRDMAKYIAKFVSRILEIYEQKQIIIHEVYLATYYLDKERQILKFPENYVQYAHKLNRKLEYLYKCLKKNLPEAHCISISNQFIADQNHKWGLAPMHFQPEYYINVLDELDKLLF